MSQNKQDDKRQFEAESAQAEQPEVMDVDSSIDEIPTVEVEGDSIDESTESNEIETLKDLLQKKEEEVEKEKKEYLFLMAEFDNFRKRTLRERSELVKSASEKVLQGLLPILDDFERGIDATKDAADANAVREGMVLIYNKFLKYLSDNGVKPMETDGAEFDPDRHEAVAMVPADDATPKGKIKDTVQKGYTLNDKILRHAKVVVAQ
ncbi:MAG: nucleotide exchange factor GrpE [Muribaculaceae bacterium]|nr:nucleotide exchange factor GrpE [Muribaculaceae bacterium]